MFNNTKRIKHLEENKLGILPFKTILRQLGSKVTNDESSLPWDLPNIVEMEKRLRALESYLNIEYKVTPAKEGYVDKSDLGSMKMLGVTGGDEPLFKGRKKKIKISKDFYKPL